VTNTRESFALFSLCFYTRQYYQYCSERLFSVATLLNKKPVEMLLQASTIQPCGTTQLVSSNLVIDLLNPDIRKQQPCFSLWQDHSALC
jgi:hypothetical protein